MPGKQEGFTFLEELSAMILISLISISLFAFAAGLQKSSALIFQQGLQSAALVDFQRAVDREFSKIKPAWWRQSLPFEAESEQIELYDMTIEIKDRELSCSQGDEHTIISIPSGYSLSITARNPADIRTGLLLELEKDRKVYTFQSLPGGRSLWVE